jgi:photosystem II stability/assembly factor-like uncharacterized protein
MSDWGQAGRRLKGPVYKRYSRTITLAAMLCSSQQALAGDDFLVLREPAIQLHQPAASLLISVTRAGDRLVAVGGHGVIIYSDDNGVTWRQGAVPVEVTIDTVGFATPLDGWAAGAYGVVLHTTDGGMTWQLQITGRQVNQLIAQNAAAAIQENPTDPAAARAVRRASFFTADGPDKPFLTIVPLSANNAIILGAYRMCIRTADAGKDWADCSLNVADPISHNLYAATLYGKTILAVGEAGDVFSADANGDAFSAIPSPSQTTLFDILKTKTGTLLAFGVADTMFRSTDNGNDWTAITLPGGADLTDGDVLDNGMIVVASENSEIFASSDDGQSFAPLPLNVGMAPYAVTQAANGNLVFVGSGGVRLATKADLWPSGN